MSHAVALFIRRGWTHPHWGGPLPLRVRHLPFGDDAFPEGDDTFPSGDGTFPDGDDTFPVGDVPLPERGAFHPKGMMPSPLGMTLSNAWRVSAIGDGLLPNLRAGWSLLSPLRGFSAAQAPGYRSVVVGAGKIEAAAGLRAEELALALLQLPAAVRARPHHLVGAGGGARLFACSGRRRKWIEMLAH